MIDLTQDDNDEDLEVAETHSNSVQSLITIDLATDDQDADFDQSKTSEMHSHGAISPVLIDLTRHDDNEGMERFFSRYDSQVFLSMNSGSD